MERRIKASLKINRKSAPNSIKRIKANARIPVEQETNQVQRNSKLKIVGQSHDEMLLTTDSRFKHYKMNEDLIIFKHCLLFCKYNGVTGSAKSYQNLIQNQPIEEVLWRICKTPRNNWNNSSSDRNTKTRTWRAWSKSGSHHVSNTSANQNRHQTEPLYASKPKWTRHRTWRRQENWFGSTTTSTNWPWKHRYSFDVLSRYFLAYPSLRQGAWTLSKIKINIMTKHAYFSVTTTSDKWSVLNPRW